ncbi:MAG: exosortase H [Pseudomonadota bacterium]
MAAFFIWFLIIQGVLFAAELSMPVQQALIIPFTELIATVSAGCIQLFDPQVVAQGILIKNAETGFAVVIKAGCNGVEATIILVAALVAFPRVSWWYKLTGVLVGFFTIQLLNLLRIISLFYLGQWSMEAFEWAHLYLWPALIMLDVLLVFLIWLSIWDKRRKTLAGSEEDDGNQAVTL